MIMSEEEKSRVWEELVKSSDKKLGVRVKSKEIGVRRKERVGWRVELVNDLKLLVILLVFWISFLSIVEILGL